MTEASKMSNGKNVSRCIEAVALLFKAPRTRLELCEAMGVFGSADYIQRYIKTLRGEGLLYIKEWPRPNSPRYAWQPVGERLPDAVRPE